MDWDLVPGNWQHLKEKVRQQWGHLTEEDLVSIAGQRGRLVQRIQACYGYERERAEREVDLFIRTL